MGKVRFTQTMSLDGYTAGPEQTRKEPLGRGGEDLHEWMFATRTFRQMGGDESGETGLDDERMRRWNENIGAHIMGRNMFGPVRGDWGDEDWRGWWGDDPPYHAPVFVLTHHAREPVEMQGGTTFHFVTDGIEAALERAREAAGERSVSIAGGPGTLNQYLAAGLVDELRLHVAPFVAGHGERIFDGVGGIELTPVSSRATRHVTHLVYRR